MKITSEIYKIFFRIFLFVTLPISLFSQQVNSPYTDSIFTQAYTKSLFSGHVVISKKGVIVFDKFYGKADYEKSISFNRQTVFQIASISKQFTATAILLLKQQNKVSLNDYVYKYLPLFPYRDVQIKHLLSHTSGMPNFVNTMWKDLDTTKVNGNQEMLEMLYTGKYPQQWKANERWEYCDIGFCTAATLVEVISGKPFKQFMTEQVFRPSKMLNTTAEFFTDTRSVPRKCICKGYELNANNNKLQIAYDLPKNSYVWWLGKFYGDGSVHTTGYDMLKWANQLFKGKLLSAESKRKLFSPTILNNGRKAEDWGFDYGMGWYLGYNANVGKFYFHAGGQTGFSAKYILCPESEIAIVLLSNIFDEAFYQFSNM